MRLNNKSARLAVNAWLTSCGRDPLGSDLSYEQFATELRKVRAATVVQVAFKSRADAVAYIRETARTDARAFLETMKHRGSMKPDLFPGNRGSFPARPYAGGEGAACQSLQEKTKG
ncbi:MAG: hypothetical protein HLUCCA12_06510 [Rhodobacteraceae bacterium HLUCCA12]|nr:MAG: hypothetical protein HLUCCA12_06510 [Rhodobacteraceae bacterium HLUCCA12]